MRYILTHIEHGIYVGNFLRLGLWTLLDCGGQSCVVTFENVEQATAHVESWNDQNGWTHDITVESVACTSEYATPEVLLESGVNTAMVAPLFFEREVEAKYQQIRLN